MQINVDNNGFSYNNKKNKNNKSGKKIITRIKNGYLKTYLVDSSGKEVLIHKILLSSIEPQKNKEPKKTNSVDCENVKALIQSELNKSMGKKNQIKELDYYKEISDEDLDVLKNLQEFLKE